MKGSLAGLMQQAQKMQQEMQKAQDELAKLVVTGEAAGGLVKVTMSGKHAVRKVEIDPSLLEDREMLEDIVAPKEKAPQQRPQIDIHPRGRGRLHRREHRHVRVEPLGVILRTVRHLHGVTDLELPRRDRFAFRHDPRKGRARARSAAGR